MNWFGSSQRANSRLHRPPVTDVVLSDWCSELGANRSGCMPGQAFSTDTNQKTKPFQFILSFTEQRDGLCLLQTAAGKMIRSSSAVSPADRCFNIVSQFRNSKLQSVLWTLLHVPTAFMFKHRLTCLQSKQRPQRTWVQIPSVYFWTSVSFRLCFFSQLSSRCLVEVKLQNLLVRVRTGSSPLTELCRCSGG